MIIDRIRLPRRNSLQKRKFFNQNMFGWIDYSEPNPATVVIPFKNGNSSTGREDWEKGENIKDVVIPFKNGNSSTVLGRLLNYFGRWSES